MSIGKFMGSDLNHEVRFILNNDDYYYLHLRAAIEGKKGIKEIVREMVEERIQLDKEKYEKRMTDIFKPKKQRQ